MNKRENKYWDSIIGGAAALILSLTFTQNFYDKYIVNISNDIPAANAKSKAFYIILHFISKHIGKIGIQIIFGIIALIFFYIAYLSYKKQKQKNQDWKDYKDSRKL
ncbi:MAG: hypothetical protein MI739_11205 [Bacteroidales bacterium]|nr:hypothetical protein [Bacteroidales bacterium]